MGSIIVNSQNKAYVINGNALEHPMKLVRYWDGSDNLSSNKWYDRVGGQYWTLTSSTHGTGYYQFLNSSATTTSSYGTLNGVLPDLGYHFRIEIDFEIKDQSNSTGSNVVVDFGAICQTNDNTCACALYTNSSNKWGLNAKLNGNSSGSTYNITAVSDSGINASTWVRRKIIFGVRASVETGKDECFAIVQDVGSGVTTTKFTPIRMNRWNTSQSSYIARSSIQPTSTYPYASNIRIYSIKIYKE